MVATNEPRDARQAGFRCGKWRWGAQPRAVRGIVLAPLENDTLASVAPDTAADTHSHKFPRIRRWVRQSGGYRWSGEVIDRGASGVEFRLLMNRQLVVSQRFPTRHEALEESARQCEQYTTAAHDEAALSTSSFE